MKGITVGIGEHMNDEKKVMSGLESSFADTKVGVAKLMSNMDNVLGKAAGNMWCYVALFTVIICALLFKFAT